MSLLALLLRPPDFGERVETCRAALLRVAHAWCHDRALAEDLVQETLCKALASAPDLRDPARLRSWLFSILANCWRDHFRRQRPAEDIDAIDEALLPHQPSAEDLHARHQTAARVRAAVARLPVGQRQVLTLVDLEEFSYAEVSAILGIPVGTVMSRLCRARQALREHLKPDAAVVPLRRVR